MIDTVPEAPKLLTQFPVAMDLPANATRPVMVGPAAAINLKFTSKKQLQGSCVKEPEYMFTGAGALKSVSVP